MIEIKFRIKIRGKWEYFTPYYSEIFSVELECDSDESTLCQFTGLKDKNGKDIYEGDIIDLCKVEHPEDDSSIKEIVFDFGMYRAKSKKHSFSFGLDDTLKHLSYVVIGNIHENPELITK